MLKTILNHKSIRKYKPQDVEEEKLNQILEAGIRASTTGNMQLYSIIITKDKLIKEQLCKAHFNQEMVLQAPIIMTFCADVNRFSKWCEINKAEPSYDNFLFFINASIDALLVAQNICIAAEEFGLGICYLGTAVYNAPEIIKILDIPQNVVPITTITLGYPDEIPDKTDRLPLDAVIHKEKYSNYSDTDIKNIYKEKENLVQTKKLIEQNKTENLAQIFTEKRYKKEDNLFFSNKFFETLKTQNFIK